jgi:hypothetical protein
MSSAKKARTIRYQFGNEIPGLPLNYSRIIADALRRDLGKTHAAVKTVVERTGANERAVKNWFAAKNGPNGHHLVKLMQTSDGVLEAVLIMAGRGDLVAAKKLADTEQLLIQMLELVGELRGLSNPRDVIYAAFHSGLVRYPLENDRAPRNHWIGPVASAHFTRVVMRELEASGFEIIQKTP